MKTNLIAMMLAVGFLSNPYILINQVKKTDPAQATVLTGALQELESILGKNFWNKNKHMNKEIKKEKPSKEKKVNPTTKVGSVSA